MYAMLLLRRTLILAAVDCLYLSWQAALSASMFWSCPTSTVTLRVTWQLGSLVGSG